MERYVIRGGREGYDRLLLLARASWPATAALFGRAGIRAGMQCVDLGCGGGEVTFELARLAGGGGSVTGVDMDEVKLGLAQKAAVVRGVSNVEFLAGNVNDWDEPGAYDVVYARFLLQHLSEPVDMLRRMWAAARPGGRVIVEDPDFDGWCCHPPNEGFDFFVRAYAEVIRRRGGDHASGRKLYRYFLDAGLPAPQVALVQSVVVSGEEKGTGVVDAGCDKRGDPCRGRGHPRRAGRRPGQPQAVHRRRDDADRPSPRLPGVVGQGTNVTGRQPPGTGRPAYAPMCIHLDRGGRRYRPEPAKATNRHMIAACGVLSRPLAPGPIQTSATSLPALLVAASDQARSRTGRALPPFGAAGWGVAPSPR